MSSPSNVRDLGVYILKVSNIPSIVGIKEIEHFFRSLAPISNIFLDGESSRMIFKFWLVYVVGICYLVMDNKYTAQYFVNLCRNEVVIGEVPLYFVCDNG